MAEIRLVKSLQRKVTLITSAAIAGALVLGIHGAHTAEQLEQHRHLDMHLAEVAQTVIEFSRRDASLASQGSSQPPQRYAPADANLDLSFQVWMHQGPQLLGTNMPEGAAPLMPLGQIGFVDAQVDGQRGRVLALPSPDQSYVVQVAEQYEDHDADTATLVRYYFLPIALPLLFAMGTTWYLLRRSACALNALVQRLRHLDLNDMQPLSIKHPPQEIVPVIREVNTAFQRASTALQTEQRFTAMAAHELRTPLAGIKAQIQLALGSDNDSERREALQEVIGGVNRAAHMFDQLFDLTRLDSAGRDYHGRRQQVSLDAVYQQVMDELDARAQAQQMVLKTDWQAPSVWGLDFALFLLLRNLLSNAILYAGAGGRIDVTSAPDADGVLLYVDDSGPGIAPDKRSQAFERFNRLGQRSASGVGLGLSIVQMVVDLHHATIALQDAPLGGLRVRVHFPSEPLESAHTYNI